MFNTIVCNLKFLFSEKEAMSTAYIVEAPEDDLTPERNTNALPPQQGLAEEDLKNMEEIEMVWSHVLFFFCR